MGEFYLPLGLWERQAYFIEDSQSGIWRGILFGIWMMVLVSNLVIYAAIRHRSLLSYFAFAAAYGIYEFFYSEVGLGYLVVVEADVSRLVMVSSLAISIFSARMLASDLFEMRARHSFILQILNWLSWGALATALSYVYFDYATVMTVQKSLLIPVATLILATGVREVASGNRLAIYSMSAWGLLLSGLIISSAGHLQWVVPVTPMTEAIAPIGFTLMMLTLGFALSAELNRRSKDSHSQLIGANQEQREINQQLEAMVKARTEELESALTELSDAHESLKELNTVDALTGIKNRQYFDTIFEQEWRRASRQKYPLSLLLLDIDHFKRVNDTFGHLVGDECLRVFARSVSDLLRRPADIVARYGGEEFVVVLPYVENDNAVMLAEQIRNAIADRRIDTNDEVITITCSVGVSTAHPSEGDDRKDAIAAADIALYEAKASGRNRVSNAGNLAVETEVRKNQTS
ncbi:MAG: diguanylate cyclase [Pseudomonadota bacterium]